MDLAMDQSQANSPKYQRQLIDAEIKLLEESIRELKHRRNALALTCLLSTQRDHHHHILLLVFT